MIAAKIILGLACLNLLFLLSELALQVLGSAFL
jgi:hypothetical protein